jgi:hypothetical protein
MSLYKIKILDKRVSIPKLTSQITELQGQMCYYSEGYDEEDENTPIIVLEFEDPLLRQCFDLLNKYKGRIEVFAEVRKWEYISFK